jgi:hypothetical protein
VREMVPAAGEAEEGVERGRMRRGGRGGDSDELERKERIRLRGHQLVKPRRRDSRRQRGHRRGGDGSVGSNTLENGQSKTKTE